MIEYELPPDQIERIVDAAERGETFAIIDADGQTVAVMMGIEEYEMLVEAMRECVGVDDG